MEERKENKIIKIVLCKNGFYVTRIQYEDVLRPTYLLTIVNQHGNDDVTVNLTELYDELICLGEVID